MSRNNPLSMAFFACDECRTVYCGKVNPCRNCETEDPDMTWVVPSKPSLTRPSAPDITQEADLGGVD